MISLVEDFAVRQFVKASFVVRSLHLRENRFDRVELWTIPNIENRFDVQSLVLEFHLFMAMNCKLVHEQSNWNFVLFLDLLKVVDEVLMVDCFVVDKERLNSFF